MFIWRTHGWSIYFTLWKWMTQVLILCVKSLNENKSKIKMNAWSLNVINTNEITGSYKLCAKLTVFNEVHHVKWCTIVLFYLFFKRMSSAQYWEQSWTIIILFFTEMDHVYANHMIPTSNGKSFFSPEVVLRWREWSRISLHALMCEG